MLLKNDSKVNTVTIENHSNADIRCFFLSTFIPNGINIINREVKINGVVNESYLYEHDPPNSVYEDNTAYRFVADNPHQCSDNIIMQGDIVEIKYETNSAFDIPNFSYVGWDAEKNESFFGYNL